MKTVKCAFLSGGKNIRKTAILNDSLDSLSSSRKNEAFDIFMEEYGDGYWSVFFEGDPGIQYEVKFRFDTEGRRQTLEPVKAVTWENDVITDVQKVTVHIR